MSVLHATKEILDAGLDAVRQSPKDDGVLEMIVRRPKMDDREIIEEAELNEEVGLVGDSWGSRATPRWTPHPDTQLTIMNSRAAALVAQERARWPLAGDQLYIDLDLSIENLPPGTRLSLGSAIIEVTKPPHRGCSKFAARFGEVATKYFNSAVGRKLNLRGINARVARPGLIRVGDIATCV